VLYKGFFRGGFSDSYCGVVWYRKEYLGMMSAVMTDSNMKGLDIKRWWYYY
jgi:hypothetical protein